MDIEYEFKNQCYPFIEVYECHIEPPVDLTQGSLLGNFKKMLEKQLINTEIICSISFSTDNGSTWQQASDEALPKERQTNKIKLRISLKDCESNLQEQVKSLEKELQSLKEIFENFKRQQAGNLKLEDSPKIEKQNSQELSPTQKNQTPCQPLPSANFNRPESPSIKKETDIAYLYAMPIVKVEQKKLIPLNNPIDAYKEIDVLQKEIKESAKEVVFRINVGTYLELMSALAMKPMILHISCHGGWEIIDNEPKLFLYLESSKLNGEVEKFSVEEIKRWFQGEIIDPKESRPRLVFVSACYSQQFGEAIKEAGVPNVVAVNSDTQVADEAATRFAKIFYHYLMRGRTVKEAFEFTKNDGKVSLRNIKLCCCTHNHKQGCFLIKALVENQDVHTTHIPDCLCDFGGNIHWRTCPWVNKMKENDYLLEPVPGCPKKVRVCCCNPSLPHNEEEKFVLISRDKEAENETIFPGLPDNEPIIVRSFDGQIVPIVDEQLIGKNIELHRLVSFLISPKHEHKVIALIGPKGLEKMLLAKTAAKYVIERKFFSDGIRTFTLRSTTFLLSSLNSVLLPPPFKEAKDYSELGQSIKSLNMLIIIQCPEVINTTALELIKDLFIIINEGALLKFIIIGKKKIDHPDVALVQLEEKLDTFSAYTIIKQKFPEWKCSYPNCKDRDLIALCVTPLLAKKAAHLLKVGPDSLDEVYLKLRKEMQKSGNEHETPNKEGYSKQIEDLFSKLRDQCEELAPIFYLAQVPSGLLASDFQLMWEEDFCQWKEKAGNFVGEKQEVQVIVVATKCEELKEEKYEIVADEYKKYVNQHLLDSGPRASYQWSCLEKFAIISRKLVRSYNINCYKCIKHSDFSGIIDDGIWACLSYENSQSSFGRFSGDPVARFQFEQGNFLFYLETGHLDGILADLRDIDVELCKTLDLVKELALCTFTMLLLLERPNEAIHVADCVQGFIGNQIANNRFMDQKKVKKKFAAISGLMKILKGGMVLKEKKMISKEDAQSQAEMAQSAFKEAENMMGIGESLYLFALILAADPNRKQFAIPTFEKARLNFKDASYQLGIAKVNLAQSIFLLSENQGDPEKINQMLTTALKILETKPYYENMQAECYYQKALCSERLKDYDKFRENIKNAREKSGCVENKEIECRCVTLINKIFQKIQKDCPLFTFLRSSPIVNKQLNIDSDVIPLECDVYNPSFFKPIMIGCLEDLNFVVKVHFDSLNPDTLKAAFDQCSSILRISVDYHSPNMFGFVGPLGELEELPLLDFKEIVSKYCWQTKCKLIIIDDMDPMSIAHIFLELGIPHVIACKRDMRKLKISDENIPWEGLINKASQHFCKDLCKNLIQGDFVLKAFERAKSSMIAFFQTSVEEFGVKGLTLDESELPVLLPENPTGHNVKILPPLKVGKILETSYKKGISDFVQERRPRVDRQVEMYQIAKYLTNNTCVNLHGKIGVGKTKLAKDIGFFLLMHSHFIGGINYRDDAQQIHNPKFFGSSEADESSEKNSQALFIIDDMDYDIWKKEKHFFKFLRDDRKIVFLFISREPLENVHGFLIERYMLKPFQDENVSIDYVLSDLEQLKYKITGQQLKVKKPTRSIIRHVISQSLGFREANGNPKLLHIFAEKIPGAKDITEISLREDSVIDVKLRRLIKVIDHCSVYLKRPSKLDSRHSVFISNERLQSVAIFSKTDINKTMSQNSNEFLRQSTIQLDFGSSQLLEGSKDSSRRNSHDAEPKNDMLSLQRCSTTGLQCVETDSILFSSENQSKMSEEDNESNLQDTIKESNDESDYQDEEENKSTNQPKTGKPPTGRPFKKKKKKVGKGKTSRKQAKK